MRQAGKRQRWRQKCVWWYRDRRQRWTETETGKRSRNRRYEEGRMMVVIMGNDMTNALCVSVSTVYSVSVSLLLCLSLGFSPHLSCALCLSFSTSQLFHVFLLTHPMISYDIFRNYTLLCLHHLCFCLSLCFALFARCLPVSLSL